MLYAVAEAAADLLRLSRDNLDGTIDVSLSGLRLVLLTRSRAALEQLSLSARGLGRSGMPLNGGCGHAPVVGETNSYACL